MHWFNTEFNQLEQRYRANLINSVGGFKCLHLVGTQSENGNLNLSLFSSYFHLGADPALFGIVVRPAEMTENTLGNILRTGYFTLNHVTPEIYMSAHQCSARYPAGVNEFEKVGLTPQFIESIPAPFVLESAIKMGCEFVEKINIGINGTTIIVGKMIYVEAPDEAVASDGSIQLEMAHTVTCSGLDTYHTTQLIGKLPYAKVEKPLV
jgi:flavin reductase (DIM6/NTAB) family NADH-FMN oxidoreductase RutF